MSKHELAPKKQIQSLSLLFVCALAVIGASCAAPTSQSDYLPKTTGTPIPAPSIEVKKAIRKTAEAQQQNHSALPLDPKDINLSSEQIVNLKKSVFLLKFPYCNTSVSGFLVKKENQRVYFATVDHWFSDQTSFCTTIGASRSLLNDFPLQVYPLIGTDSFAEFENASASFNQELDQQIIVINDKNNYFKDAEPTAFIDDYAPAAGQNAFTINYSPSYYDQFNKQAFIFKSQLKPNTPIFNAHDKFCAKGKNGFLFTGLPEGGQSGSPIFIIANNKPRAIALNAARFADDDYFGCAVPLKLTKLIDQARNAFFAIQYATASTPTPANK